MEQMHPHTADEFAFHIDSQQCNGLTKYLTDPQGLHEVVYEISQVSPGVGCLPYSKTNQTSVSPAAAIQRSLRKGRASTVLRVSISHLVMNCDVALRLVG